MIGREGEVRPFDLIRWARAQARFKRLKPLEAHVLLLLATYANVPDCKAWPSIKTLAEHCGLKPHPKTGTNSSVSAAIRGLEEKGLIWSHQAGRGHPAKRELLYNPAAVKPSGIAESNGHADAPVDPSAFRDAGEQDAPLSGPAFLPAGCEPSGTQDAKYQENGQHQQQQPEQRTARGSHPAGRMASHPPRRNAVGHPLDTDRSAVRAAITDSLSQAASA